MSDPSIRWLRLRKYLLDNAECDLWTVLQIEQAFIAAVEVGDKSKLIGAVGSVRIPEETGILLKAFATSLFTDVLAGAVASAITG